MYDDAMHDRSTSPAAGARRSRLRRAGDIAPRWIAELLACLLIGALLSLADGTDANWDLQNYHLYAPFAVLHGRLGLDYFAGGFQAYLNPLQDMPYLLARTALFAHAPRLLALCAGLPFGCLAFIVFRLARVLIEDGWGAIFAALIGLTGATTLSEIGTTFDDILTGCVVLPALLAIVGRWRHAAAIAGGLCGLAIALKLTAVIFVVPLAGAIVIMAPAPREVWAMPGVSRWRQRSLSRSDMAGGACCCGGISTIRYSRCSATCSTRRSPRISTRGTRGSCHDRRCSGSPIRSTGSRDAASSSPR